MAERGGQFRPDNIFIAADQSTHKQLFAGERSLGTARRDCATMRRSCGIDLLPSRTEGGNAGREKAVALISILDSSGGRVMLPRWQPEIGSSAAAGQ